MEKAVAILEETRKNVVLSVLGITPVEQLSSASEAYLEWQRFQNIQAILDEYARALREKLFSYANAEGQLDGKGSYVVQFEDGTGFKRERRVSISINKERAIELAKAKKLDHLILLQVKSKSPAAKKALERLTARYADEVETELDIDEEGLASAYSEGQISDAELEACTNRKESWALVDLSKQRRR